MLKIADAESLMQDARVIAGGGGTAAFRRGLARCGGKGDGAPPATPPSGHAADSKASFNALVSGLDLFRVYTGFGLDGPADAYLTYLLRYSILLYQMRNV